MQLKSSDTVYFNGQNVKKIYINNVLVYEKSGVTEILIAVPVGQDFYAGIIDTYYVTPWYYGYWNYSFAEKIYAATTDLGITTTLIPSQVWENRQSVRQLTAPQLIDFYFDTMGQGYGYYEGDDSIVAVIPLESGFTLDPMQLDGTNKDLRALVDVVKQRRSNNNFQCKILMLCKDLLLDYNDFDLNNGLPDMPFDVEGLAISELRYTVGEELIRLMKMLYDKTDYEGRAYDKIVLIGDPQELSDFTALLASSEIRIDECTYEEAPVDYKSILINDNMKEVLNQIIDAQGEGFVGQNAFVLNDRWQYYGPHSEYDYYKRVLYVCLSNYPKIQNEFRMNMEKICNERGGGSGIYLSFIKNGDLEPTFDSDYNGDNYQAYSTELYRMADSVYDYICSELVRLYEKALCDEDNGLEALKSVCIVCTDTQWEYLKQNSPVDIEYFTAIYRPESELQGWWLDDHGINEDYVDSLLYESFPKYWDDAYRTGYAICYCLADGMFQPLATVLRDDYYKSQYPFEYIGDVTHHIAGILNFDAVKTIAKAAAEFKRSNNITALPMEESEPNVVQYMWLDNN